MQEERELIEDQRHADAEQGGGDSRPRRAVVLDDEAADPAHAHQQTRIDVDDVARMMRS